MLTILLEIIIRNGPSESVSYRWISVLCVFFFAFSCNSSYVLKSFWDTIICWHLIWNRLSYYSEDWFNWRNILQWNFNWMLFIRPLASREDQIYFFSGKGPPRRVFAKCSYLMKPSSSSAPAQSAMISSASLVVRISPRDWSTWESSAAIRVPLSDLS